MRSRTGQFCSVLYFCKKVLLVCLMNKLTDKNFKYMDNYLLEGACYSFLIKKTSSREEKS